MRFIISITLGLLLSACMVVPPSVGRATFNIAALDETKISELEENKLSVIIHEFPSNAYIKSNFVNLDTGKDYAANHFGTHISVIFVPPGRYQFQRWREYDSANARRGGKGDIVERFFQPFDVAGGETVYVGTISAKRKEVKYTTGKTKGPVTSVLLPFYDPNSTFENVYSVKDNSKIINNRWIAWYHPELKGKVKTRLMTLNQGVVSNAVINSRSLDKVSASGKEQRAANKDLEAFLDTHGPIDNIKDEALKKEYYNKRARLLTARRVFLTDYIERYGEDNVKPEVLAEKKRLDADHALKEKLIEIIKARAEASKAQDKPAEQTVK